MRYTILLILLIYSCGLSAQKKDSLYKEFKLGWEMINNSQRPLARVHFNQLYKDYTATQHYTQRLQCQTALAYILFFERKYDSMLLILEPELKETLNHVDSISSAIASAYSYIGLAYANQGDLINTNKNYELALQHGKQIKGFSLGSIYSGLYHVCRKRSDYKQAYDYALHKLESDSKSTFPNISFYHSYSKFGWLEGTRKNYQKETVFYHKALMHALKAEDLSQKKGLLQNAYQNIGFSHYRLKQFDSTIIYSHISLGFRKQDSPSPNISYTVSYNNLVAAYLGLGNIDSANYYANRSLQLMQQKQKNFKQSYRYAKAHYHMAKVLEYEKKHFEAAKNYQLGISYYLSDFFEEDIYSNPSLNTTNSEDALMYAIEGKARSLAQLAIQSQSAKDRQMAVETYLLAMKLVDKMRQQFEAQGSKSFLATRVWWVFESAIKNCLDLYKATGDARYQQYAFQFAEKSKAVLVQDAVSESVAQRKVAVPDSLLEYEHDLKVEITFIENKLFQAERGKKTEKASELRTTLLDKRNDLRLFAQRLAKEYPSYHQLRYNRGLADLAAIQETLPSDQAILEYFVGDSAVYTFTLTNQSLAVSSFPYSTELSDQVKQLREGLHPKKQSKDARSYQLFTQSAYALYQSILEKALSKLPSGINKLSIIADGELSYIPFEVLLTQAADPEIADYRQPDYLIKRYQISYAYSASLLNANTKSLNQPSQEGVLAFAPSYSAAIQDSTELQQLGRFRDQVVPLIWNGKEVEQISQYLPTASFMAEAATEQQFKALASDYRIIHLAMHALVDDENPMGSRLAFTNNAAGSEDNYLNAYELYNMKLNADLAILSACNTGYGKYVRGEGLVSLGRAFAYAGCPSVVISHWSVDDQATSMLMKGFYQGLSNGLDKAAAMHQAKLDYLENTGPREANPIYWGSFVLIGDVAPITSTFPWLWLGLGIGAILAFAAWRLRQRGN